MIGVSRAGDHSGRDGGVFEASLKQRVLALRPASADSERTRIDHRLSRYPAARGSGCLTSAASDPFVIGTRDAEFRGAESAAWVVRGVEAGKNPVVTSEWSRFMVSGNLFESHQGVQPAGAGARPPPEGGNRDSGVDTRRQAEGQTR